VIKNSRNHFHIFLLLSTFVFLLVSAIHPHDYLTWFLETFPVMLGGILLVATYRKLPLTTLLYLLLWLHAIILIIGGHYTYAEVPLFNYLKDTFHGSRNYYDRLGHLFQGFVPAIVARELLIRKSVVKSRAWLYFIVVCICLAFSACYELFEAGAAMTSGEATEAFLGSQGDVWDTQWDMFMALIGANLALLTLARRHDKQLELIDEKGKSS
jgi:putative membrane protein